MAGRQPISRGGRATGVALTAAVFVAGCGGAEGTGPSVGRVEITPDNTLLVGIGDTVTLEARVHGTGGSTLSGAAVAWRTLDPAAWRSASAR